MSSSEKKKIVVTVFLSVRDQAEIGIKETNYTHSSTFLTAVYCCRLVLRCWGSHLAWAKSTQRGICSRKLVQASNLGCAQPDHLVALQKSTVKTAGATPQVLSCFFAALLSSLTTSQLHCGGSCGGLVLVSKWQCAARGRDFLGLMRSEKRGCRSPVMKTEGFPRTKLLRGLRCIGEKSEQQQETFLKVMCACRSIYFTRGLSLNVTLNLEKQIEGGFFEPFWLSIIPICYSM